ncbi:2Fe-2S ferredoxin-type domain-containing protein [Phyllosticta paracitricarpa]
MPPVHCAVRSLCASLPRARPSLARLQTPYQRLIHRAAAPSVSSAPVRLASQSAWRCNSRDSAMRSRRSFSTTPAARHGHLHTPKPGEERKVTFIDKDGDEHTFEVADGDNLLDIAQANDLEMEGACGGSCACSTCHVIVDDSDMYDQIPEPDDDENDMLDLAFGLTETSRLGCQVKMSKELDGLVVRLPSMTRNLQASDFADKI